MKMIVAVVAVLMVSLSLASAETRPADVSNGSTCQSKAVKEYLASIDPLESTRQEWHINNGDTYLKLEAMGFIEC
jgi:hypothetical protein